MQNALNAAHHLLVVITLIAGLVLTGPAHAGGSCQSWFKNTGAIPGTPDCQSVCASGRTGLGTWSCPSQCDDYCSTPAPTIDDGKSLGSCQSGTAFAGDPINIATGNTFERVTDYTPGTEQDPAVERYYNSGSSVTEAHLGAHWRSGFAASIDREDDTATLYRPDGQVLVFTRSDDDWTADGDVTGKLQSLGGHDASDGWRYDTPDNTVELYDADGRLIEAQAPGRYDWTLTYDSGGQLSRVASATGRDLTLSHDGQGRITKITLPDGGEIQYGYDDNDNLSEVHYPADSKKSSITYEYDNANHPHALTALVDENGVTFSNWTYNDDGKATSSTHADGADQTTLDYASGSTTVTNALGRETTYDFKTILGVPRVTHVKGKPTSTCAGADKDYSYTDSGWIASKTDWNGNSTKYAYNDRGLQTRRTEAASTSAERTIKTSWSQDFRRPTEIDTPTHSTQFHYDDEGRLTERTVTDTGSGKTRTWTYTYAADQSGLPGKVHSIDGPRTDVDDTTTFAYDSHGDLT